MKTRLSTLMAIAMLVGLVPGMVFAAPLAAQGVEPVPGEDLSVKVAVVDDGAAVESGPSAYLPIMVAPGEPGPPPPSPYAAALSQALADCADTALNQVCYAQGSVTLDGGGPLTTPGQVASLDGVSGLTLVSPDAGHWSVALLRLAADSPTPDLGLTLLVFGNVEIHSLTLFDAAAGNGNVAPALSFSSSPVPGQDPVTGGLIVYNPTDEELLSIGLNGADLTLASSAVVQAQPGDKMTVTMATGSALVKTAAGDGALLQADQRSVPLDGDGKAAGAPTPPTAIDDDLLAPLTCEGDCLLAPLVPQSPAQKRRQAYDGAVADFWTAHDRCLQGNSHQVYRVMCYARIIRQYEAEFPSEVPGWLDRHVKECATFEIEFNSVITPITLAASGTMHIQGQGMIVSYGADGSLVQPALMPLTHLRYDINFAWPPGTYILVLDDGLLGLTDSYMRINHNRLDISTTVYTAGVWEHLIITAGDIGEIANPVLWDVLWRQLHEFELDGLATYRFTPDHWKYTGNQILAEAIITDRKVTFADGEVTGDTWLVMLHTPRR